MREVLIAEIGLDVATDRAQFTEKSLEIDATRIETFHGAEPR
ncbi:MAG: hypothetical protein ACXWUG_02275 [Polyangiales bacterium]